MECQVAERLGTSFGHTFAANGAKRLDVNQLIVEILQDAIPIHCCSAPTLRLPPLSRRLKREHERWRAWIDYGSLGFMMSNLRALQCYRFETHDPSVNIILAPLVISELQYSGKATSHGKRNEINTAQETHQNK